MIPWSGIYRNLGGGYSPYTTLIYDIASNVTNTEALEVSHYSGYRVVDPMGQTHVTELPEGHGTVNLPSLEVGRYKVTLIPLVEEDLTLAHEVRMASGAPTSPASRLIEVRSFGDYSRSDSVFRFDWASSLVKVPKTLPENLTSLSQMFYECTAFNDPNVSQWDVSSVTGMRNLFWNATNFDQPIGNWNISNVTNMGSMFYGATRFNQDISNWDTRNVVVMSFMFSYCTNFNQNLNTWDVSGVTNMAGMFRNATVFNQDISSWDTGNVTNMSNMFFNCYNFNRNISDWDTSNVTDMDWMFRSASSFDQDLSGWCVSNLTTEPINFNTDGILAPNHYPVWGTCPRGEDQN